MGNAGSTSMHQRERHKSSDLSTPNSPYREIIVGGIGPVGVITGVSGGGSGSSGSGSGTAGVTIGQMFSFDKKCRDSVLCGTGSSQEEEEVVSEPYYTKPIATKATGVMAMANNTTNTRATRVTGTTATTAIENSKVGAKAVLSNNSEVVAPGDVDFGGPIARKRSLTISEGQKRAPEHHMGRLSSEVADKAEDQNKKDSLSSSGKMSAEDDSNKNRHPALPTVLRWDGGGKNVMISGTFSKWKPIPMVRSHGNFVTIIDLPEGDHQYKFCVDGEWKHDPKLKSIENSDGDTNNLVTVRQSDFEVFQALAKDGEQGTTNAEREYSQEVPQVKPWDKVSAGPPILPPHLLQVILNKDTPLSCEPTLLPEPNHVMLNHLYALSIKDGVMVLSATHRYRKKYVTTLLYKPI